MKKIGLGLFIASFLFFISLLFLGKFKLSETSLKASLSQNQEVQVSILKSTEGFKKLASQSTSSQFQFIEGLKKMFFEANELVIKNYGISEEEIKELIVQATVNGKVGYNQDVVNQVFPDQDETNILKNKKLIDNTSWMFEKGYNDKASFENDLRNKVSEIRNAIIGEKGFEDYAIKGLLFSVTKNSSVGFIADNKWLLFLLTFILCAFGALLYIIPSLKGFPGIKNNGVYHNKATNAGWVGIAVGSFLIGFYIMLYFFPEYITNWILPVDPLSKSLNGGAASQWFMYGFLYCLAMTVMGIRMILKYRHNKYQIIRTISVLFFQLAFAFLIPEILVRLNKPYFDFKNMWPLDYDFFFDWNLNNHLQQGNLGLFMLIWGIALFVIGVPFFTYFFGKRWYCSWVCGCGGLAETLGDPYRQLSDKSLTSWKIERYLIHGVLGFVVIMTVMTLYSYFSGATSVMGIETYTVQKSYGFLIGSVFSGVVGTGFYPFMGSRVWCRFGCPLAAYLGIVQRFKSRFRITTNGGQCISCGNCSTYCEMGIDVRSYAQKGQNIVRSSCVGCGVCSAVCPRGVLKLENGSLKNRVDDNPIILGLDGSLKLNENI